MSAAPPRISIDVREIYKYARAIKSTGKCGIKKNPSFSLPEMLSFAESKFRLYDELEANLQV